jgi:hypothetical protein
MYAALFLVVVLGVAGCRTDPVKETRSGFEPSVSAEPEGPKMSPPPVTPQEKPKTAVPAKKRSIVDIASRPLKLRDRAVSAPRPTVTTTISAKPIASLSFEGFPEPPPPRLPPPVNPPLARSAPTFSPRVWYCVASVCGGMFTYILAPLLVEFLKDCMPRRRRAQDPGKLPRLLSMVQTPHFRGWARRW